MRAKRSALFIPAFLSLHSVHGHALSTVWVCNHKLIPSTMYNMFQCTVYSGVKLLSLYNLKEIKVNDSLKSYNMS